jgi:hypothetical protein
LTRGGAEGGCLDVSFTSTYAVGDSALVALEDYARALTRARGAEAIPSPADPARLSGLHLCAPDVEARGDMLDEIEAFARHMAHRTGDGLGWS